MKLLKLVLDFARYFVYLSAGSYTYFFQIFRKFVTLCLTKKYEIRKRLVKEPNLQLSLYTRQTLIIFQNRHYGKLANEGFLGST